MQNTYIGAIIEKMQIAIIHKEKEDLEMFKNLLRILVIAMVVLSVPYEMAQAKENKNTYDYSIRDGIECFKIEESTFLQNEKAEIIKEKLIAEKRLTEIVHQIRETKFEGRVKRSKTVLLFATEKPNTLGKYKPVEVVNYVTNQRKWLDDTVVKLSQKIPNPYRLVDVQKKDVPVGEKEKIIVFVANLQREL